MAGNDRTRNMSACASAWCRRRNIRRVFARWLAPGGVIRIWRTSYWPYLSFSGPDSEKRFVVSVWKLHFRPTLQSARRDKWYECLASDVCIHILSLSMAGLFFRSLIKRDIKNWKWSFYCQKIWFLFLEALVVLCHAIWEWVRFFSNWEIKPYLILKTQFEPNKINLKYESTLEKGYCQCNSNNISALQWNTYICPWISLFFNIQHCSPHPPPPYNKKTAPRGPGNLLERTG